MKDTKQRIAEYKEKLPKVKEKFIAMIALLIVSASMLTTVSFAWIALSVNPEVSGISTAVVSNGNLEIALASGAAVAPGATLLGDGNKNLIDKNITWGNLINLSDPSYGLSNMVLRPALLYTSDLLNSPLRAAVYSADGRVSALNSNFRYAQWKIYNDGIHDSEFVLTDQYGLRAITSTKVDGDVGPFNLKQQEYQQKMDRANGDAVNAYLAIVQNEAYINSLVNLMGHYMTARMNDDTSINNPSFDAADAENLRDTFAAFIDALEAEQQYMLAAANYQIFLQAPYAEGSSYDITLDKLLTGVSGVSKNSNTNVKTGITGFNNKEIEINLYGLASNIYDLEIIRQGYEQLVTLCANGGPYTWKESGINGILNSLVNVGNCQVYNPESGTVTINSLGASAALNYIGKSNNEAIITNGVLFNYEQRTGADMTKSDYTKNRVIKVTVKRYGITLNDQKVTASLRTSAEMTGYPADRGLAESLIPVAQGNAGASTMELRADETYGYVIDFWVRTNAVGSYLHLEGNVLTRSETEDVKGKDADGNEVQLYTVNQSVEDGEGGSTTVTRDVYYKTVRCNVTIEDEQITAIEKSETGAYILESWYYHDGHSEYPYYRLREATAAEGTGTWYRRVITETEGGTTETLEAVTDMTEPAKKVKITEVVIGYEGDNRVWDEDDSQLISINSTTQGSGSCYVFYADTPEDQERGLALLSALRVAFVDAEGNLLTEAYLDTERFYSDAGKIIVPLALTTDKVVKDEATGDTFEYITALERNEATLISAVVYLDGYQVTNEDVLATSDIQGQFNIQFGNTVIDINMDPSNNEKLESEELILSASIDKTSFDYAVDKDNMTVTVTANIEGVEPERVEAFFVRTITSTQGVPLEVFEFNGSGDTWTGTFRFTSPGTYVLRSLRIDGVEYDLAVSSRPKVTVSGFAITELGWDEVGSYHRFMTSSGSVSTEVWTKIGTSKSSPNTVVGRFYDSENGRATYVNFTCVSTADSKWAGTATFNASGEYVLDMLIVDGEYTAIDPGMQKTAEVICGMKVAVYTTSPRNIELNSDADPNLNMQVRIMDSNGKAVEALSGVHLYYGRKNYISDAVAMHTGLTWNESSGYYEGTLFAQVGEYEFLRVNIGNNEITTATNAPDFSIWSPEPPKYEGGYTDKAQFAGDGDGYLNVQLSNADRAEIEAVVQKLENGVWVYYDTITNPLQKGPNWQFAISESGTYRIQKLQFYGVYDENKNYYPTREEAAATGATLKAYEITGDAGYLEGTETTIVKALKVEVATPEQTLNGTFLEAQPWQNTVTVKPDMEEAASVVTVTGVTMTFTYDFNTSFGGYSTSDITKLSTAMGLDENNAFTVTLTKNADGTFAIPPDSTLTYAGTYTLTKVKVSAEVNGSAVSVPDIKDVDMKVYVKSEKPTVKISGVNPSNGTYRYYTTANPSSSNQLVTLTDINKKVNDYSAVVYVYFNTFSGSYDNWYDNSEMADGYLPSVSLAISGVPNGVEATISVGNANGSTYSHSADFNNGTATLSVGGVTNGTGASMSNGCSKWPVIHPAGKQEIKNVTITYNGVEFTANLSNTVTIDNPICPPTATYVINDTTFTGTVPSAVTSTTGSTYTITLPTVASWTSPGQSADGDETITTNTEKVAKIGDRGSTGSGWNVKYHYNWTLFERITTVTTTVGETTTWTNTHQVTGWRIGNTVYKPGDTVTITGDQTITAEVTVTEGEKTTENSTTVHTVVVTTQTGTTTTSTSWSWGSWSETVPEGYTRDDSATAGTTEKWE